MEHTNIVHVVVQEVIGIEGWKYIIKRKVRAAIVFIAVYKLVDIRALLN